MNAKAVTDESMGYNPDWHAGEGSANEVRGHQEEGRTLAVHSVAVAPMVQRRGLGKVVLKAYMQRMESAAVDERIALLAHDHLLEWYEGLGFENKGKSSCTFGGGRWSNMVSPDAEMAECYH